MKEADFLFPSQEERKEREHKNGLKGKEIRTVDKMRKLWIWSLACWKEMEKIRVFIDGGEGKREKAMERIRS